MPKKPFKPRARPKYMEPAVISEAKARELMNAGKPLPRNTMVVGVEAKHKSPSQLRIRFLPDGKVIQPRFFVIYGRTSYFLKTKRKDMIKNVNAAVRRAIHQRESVVEELNKTDELIFSLRQLHTTIAEDWQKFNEKQKKAAINFTSALPKKIGNINLLQNRFKKAAWHKIANSAKLMEEGNHSAGTAQLRGAISDLTARRNELERQDPYLERRHKVMFDKTSKDEQRNKEIISMLYSSFDSMKRFTPANKPALEREKKALLDLTKKLSGAKEPLLAKAKQNIFEATKAMSKGLMKRASAQTIQALNKVMLVHSLNFIMPEQRLLTLKRSKDTELKKQIVTNQIHVFYENAVYWWQRASPNQKQNMARFLQNLKNVLTEVWMPETKKKIDSAARKLSNKQLVECLEELEPMVQII